MCGGLGRCGREICCSSFIEKLETVSIKMAKEQGLSLNPTKISGLCGRLMCCLTFEDGTYKKLKERYPKVGKFVMTDKGRGKVIRHNVICSRLTVRLDEGGEYEAELADVQPEKPKG
jgi:cell fate regulator YaaT (PSP1 superfamily)